MSKAMQIKPMKIWAILDPERYIKKSIKDWSLAIYDEKKSADRQIQSVSEANNEECFIEELELCSKLEIDKYIELHNEMYEILEQLSSELRYAIGEINDMRKAKICGSDLTPPDLWDAESCYLADEILAKARGEQDA